MIPLEFGPADPTTRQRGGWNWPAIPCEVQPNRKKRVELANYLRAMVQVLLIDSFQQYVRR